MPTVLAASITSVCGGTCTSRPSIVSFTKSAMSLENSASPRLRVENTPSRHHHFARMLVRARSAVQMILKLLPELFDNRNSRHGGGVSQRAERAAQHVL